jgi:hypothetical protein
VDLCLLEDIDLCLLVLALPSYNSPLMAQYFPPPRRILRCGAIFLAGSLHDSFNIETVVLTSRTHFSRILVPIRETCDIRDVMLPFVIFRV